MNRFLIRTILIVVFLIAGPLLFADKLAVMPELLKPASICIDGEQMYIVEKANSTVNLYSMKDYKPIKQFGKKGEGPGEYLNAPSVAAFPDYILLDSFGKIQYYTRNGDYIKEKKISQDFGGLTPLKDRYIGFSYRNSDPKVFGERVAIFDSDVKEIKTLYYREKKMNPEKILKPVLRDYFGYEISGETIFVGDTKKGFYIEVFDISGKKLYVINKEYKKEKLPQRYIKKFEDWVSKSSYWKRNKDRLKIVYNEFSPAYKSFGVYSGNLYAFTYKREGDKYELILMDLKGKEKKRLFVPYTGKFSFSNNKYYYLKENEETEEWELFVEKL
ncbi:MAG: hypothetical protein GY757_21405 [bacterium]|nr:hypothetical protein [bacterium]